MIAMRSIDVRNDFKRVSDLVNAGEKVLVARPRNANLIILTETEYNAMKKACNNAQYVEKINSAIQQIADGRSVTKTMAELEAMAE